MSSRKINSNKLEELEEFLKSKGFDLCQMKTGHGVDYISPTGGKICVYKSGTILPQGTPAEVSALKEFWDENCKFAEEAEEPNKVSICYSYFIDIDKRGKIKTAIEEFVKCNEFILRQSIDPNAQYQFAILDNNKNKISITLYKTTGRLVLRGKHSVLWEQITEMVSNEIGQVINTMVANVVFNEAFALAVDQSGKEIEIINVVTSDDQANAEEWTKKRLGKCYDFLYEYDCNRVESSEVLLSIEAPLKDYFGCVSGTLEALEGFTKKLLIDIEAFSQREIMSKHPKWDFNQAVDYKTKEVSSRVKDVLSADREIRGKQEDIISDLVIKLSLYRNPHFHSGPPHGGNPIPTLARARSIHDEVVSLMKKAYETLEAEIKK